MHAKYIYFIKSLKKIKGNFNVPTLKNKKGIFILMHAIFVLLFKSGEYIK